MSARGPAPVSIRLALLDDADQISQVHRSHIQAWCRRIGEELYDVGYDALSVDERWGFGGQWMSVETCAVHLNGLLTHHHLPLVMQQGDRVIAEMELFICREGETYGKNCHIGLLYVHRDFMGQGFGRQMVEKAKAVAREHRCDTLTVSTWPQLEAFYRKCGFTFSDLIVEMEVAAKKYDVDIAPLPRPANTQSFTWGMDLKVGRYQSSAYHIYHLSHPFAVSAYTDVDVRTDFCAVGGRPAMLALVCNPSSGVNAAFAWASGVGIRDLAAAGASWLRAGGIRSANMLLSRKDYDVISEEIEGRLIGTRRALIYRP